MLSFAPDAPTQWQTMARAGSRKEAAYAANVATTQSAMVIDARLRSTSTISSSSIRMHHLTRELLS
jgi:hypothetical protein